MTTRVALHLSGGLGLRASRVLLAEAGIQVGFLSDDPGHEGTDSILSVAGWDALAVSDVSEASDPHVKEALAFDIPVAVGTHLPDGYPVGDATVVTGAALGSGLAAALALSVSNPSGEPVDTQLAWTVSGQPLGMGTPVTFPEPVGPLWAGRAESPLLRRPQVTCLVAPDDSPWMAVVANVRGRSNGVANRTLGVVDDGNFLQAISISAALVAAARGAYPPGVNNPGDPGGVYLQLARAAGMEIAEFSSERSTGD